MHKNLDSVAAAKLLKTLRALEVAGKLIWFCGFGLFVIGFYSLFWSKVPGDVLERGILHTSAGGYTTPHAARAKAITFQSARYAYSYDGQNYTSRLTCLCIPIGILKDVSSGDKVSVYVADVLPSVSVLHPGPDYVALILLLIIGAAPWGLAQLIRQQAFPQPEVTPNDQEMFS